MQIRLSKHGTTWNLYMESSLILFQSLVHFVLSLSLSNCCFSLFYSPGIYSTLRIYVFGTHAPAIIATFTSCPVFPSTDNSKRPLGEKHKDDNQREDVCSK